MINDFIVVNRKGYASLLKVNEPWILWRTCLRQMAFGSRKWERCWRPVAEDSYFEGEEAYRFCLEVICGLHSPMIGETEVYGQFRDFFNHCIIPKNVWGTNFERLIQRIYSDAKLVRHHYLRNLGSHSYGGVARRFLKNLDEIHFIGAGNLVSEMLPWFAKRARVFIHCRRLDAGKKLAEPYPNAKPILLAQPLVVSARGAGIVLAAPMTSAEAEAWLKPTKPVVILDLREQSGLDPLRHSVSVVTLGELFERIKSREKFLEEKVVRAQEHIASLAQQLTRHIDHRPFGWDDLCL